MSWRTDRNWLGAMVLLVALVAGTLALSYWEQAKGELRAQALTASEERIGSLVTLLSVMQDAETGQRGYVITGLDEYLEPYEAAHQRLGAALAALNRQYRSQPQARLELAHIRRLVGQKMNKAELTIAVRRDQGFEAAREMVLDHAGTRTMDDLRSEIGFMAAIERTQMAQAERDYTATRSRSRAVFLVLSAVVLLSMGVLLAVAARQTRASLRATRRLCHLASHDPLTGLANRRSLLTALDDLTRSGGSSMQPHGLFYLDLNGFKAVNDHLGHEAGDQLLVAVANRLKAVSRASDLVARLGGDEFAVLVPDLPSHSEGSEIVSRLKDAVASVDAPTQGHQVSASVGFASFPEQARTSAELLSLADQQM